ncbi:hypothetical protein JXL19_05355 [bacterium]|nr:hypothetical protein [bacterium]
MVYAKVIGVCSNCHTMHYSQNGTQEPEWGDEGPYGYLLTKDCLGCHTATDGGTWKDPVTGAPIVYNLSEPSYGIEYNGVKQGLAGGNFYWVEHLDDTRGHNIFPGNPDDNLAIAPGEAWAYSPDGCGSNSCHSNLDRPFQASQSFDPIHGYLNGRYGCRGCHMVSGYNRFSQIKSWHHANDSGPVVDSKEEGWFRFLSGHYSGYEHGVAGIEDDDWQYTYSKSDHNEYLGKQVASGTGSFVSIGANTMTAFCCGCHGVFHVKKSAGEWIRHPVDRIIPITNGYELYTEYDPLVPVARPDLTGWTGPRATVNQGGTVQKDMVMCLSCHRAHGSPYPDILRWDYSTIMDEKGCITCHTTKK